MEIDYSKETIPPYKLKEMSKLSSRIVSMLTGNTAVITLSITDCMKILRWAEMMLEEGTDLEHNT